MTSIPSSRSQAITFAVLLACVVFFQANDVTYADDETPEQFCLRGRYRAAAKYTACHQKWMWKYFGGAVHNIDKLAKCLARYQAEWPKLQAKAPGSSCDTSRWTDHGASLTDNLTGLRWEKKTDDGSIHDVDDTYTWSSNVPTSDGPAFTTFLAALNGACFEGYCDWRLPTIYELQTMLQSPHPCVTPCVDPIFGPTQPNEYWSSTSVANDVDHAWTVDFLNGYVFDGIPKTGFSYPVRAVRGGL